MLQHFPTILHMVATPRLCGVNPPDATAIFVDEIEDQVWRACMDYVYAMINVDTRARLRTVTFRYIQLDYITGVEGFEDHMLHRSAFEVGRAASKNLRLHETHPPSSMSNFQDDFSSMPPRIRRGWACALRAMPPLQANAIGLERYLSQSRS